jgi:acetylglutamate synthase
VVDQRGLARLEHAVALAPGVGGLDGRLAFAAEHALGEASFRRKARNLASVARFTHDILDEATGLPTANIAAALVAVWIGSGVIRPALVVRAITGVSTGSTAVGATTTAAPASAVIPARG